MSEEIFDVMKTAIERAKSRGKLLPVWRELFVVTGEDGNEVAFHQALSRPEILNNGFQEGEF